MQWLLENKTITEILNSNDEQYKKQSIKYSLQLLNDVKNGNELAFENLVKTKDIKKFIKIKSRIVKRTLKNISLNDIKNEMVISIYRHLKENYEIGKRDNELFLFVYSMNKWIAQKTIRTLGELSKTKRDLTLYENELVSDQISPYEVAFVKDLKTVLEPSELPIFELYFVNRLNISDVSKTLKMPNSSTLRRVNKIKYKLQNYIGGC